MNITSKLINVSNGQNLFYSHVCIKQLCCISVQHKPEIHTDFDGGGGFISYFINKLVGDNVA